MGRLNNTVETKQKKSLHMMTVSELQTVVRETKSTYNQYRHCFQGDKVYVQNLPYYNPINSILLDTLEAQNHIRRCDDWENHRYYVANLNGALILRSL